MVYNISIEIPYEKTLEDVFEGEDNIFPNNRAEYNITKKEKLMIIKGQAKDPTSLKALTNSICKVLNIHEKAKEVIKNH